MIRRNPDLIALGVLTMFLALLPAVASIATRAVPENKLRLIHERIRAVDEDLSRRIEERIHDKIQEKIERFRIAR